MEASCPDVTPSLAAFIARGLGATSDKRYATPEDALDAALAIERPPRAMRELAELVEAGGAARERNIEAFKPAPVEASTTASEASTGGSELRQSRARKPTRAWRTPAVLAALVLTLLSMTGWLWSSATPARDDGAPPTAAPVAGALDIPSRPSGGAISGAPAAAQPAHAALPVHAKPNAVATGSAPKHARHVPSSASKKPGTLRVIAVPFGKVWLDGTLRGRAPLELEVAAGVHQLNVGRREPTLKQTVIVRPGELREIVVRY